jgi:hypothetical protein
MNHDNNDGDSDSDSDGESEGDDWRSGTRLIQALV